MITYKRCTEVSEDAIFEAFQTGFSDYIIKIEMTKDNFIKHFFGPEGNRLEYSVMAFDDDKPIGLNLGGIKVYEGIKTLRCGALCVRPDYRGLGISSRLFDIHKEIAIENKCRQMCLEVIKGNDRAINFYRKHGYEKVYDIVYYSHNDPSEINTELPDDVSINEISLDSLRSLSDEIRETHINWQNDFDYISHFVDQVHYGVYKGTTLAGAISIHPSGRINFLWVNAGFRNKGIGKGLISHAAKEVKPKKLSINFPDNVLLLGFLKRLNFTEDPISQHEMRMVL